MLTTDSPLPFPDWGILLMSIQGEASPDSCFMDQGSGIRDQGSGIRDTGYGIQDTGLKIGNRLPAKPALAID